MQLNSKFFQWECGQVPYINRCDTLLQSSVSVQFQTKDMPPAGSYFHSIVWSDLQSVQGWLWWSTSFPSCMMTCLSFFLFSCPLQCHSSRVTEQFLTWSHQDSGAWFIIYEGTHWAVTFQAGAEKLASSQSKKEDSELITQYFKMMADIFHQ